MIETKGLTAAIECADRMCKSANVKLLGYKTTGGGLVMTAIKGKVAAVKVAVEATKGVENIVHTHVIPNPHESVYRMFPIQEDYDYYYE